MTDAVTARSWCIPCFQRGRKRPATRMVANEPWCEQCYAGSGSGFEEVGGQDTKVAANKRAYRERNKEQVAANKRAYRERNKEQVAAYQRAYYERNKEQVAANQRAYYERNKEQVAANQRGAEMGAHA